MKPSSPLNFPKCLYCRILVRRKYDKHAALEFSIDLGNIFSLAFFWTSKLPMSKSWAKFFVVKILEKNIFINEKNN